MNYQVVLTARAEAQLAELWLSAADRAETSWAADAIDRQLKRNPNHAGTLLFDTVRRLRMPPLVVDFEVTEDDRLVNVLRFQLIDSLEDS
jgi:hypothetical protein